MYIPVDFQIKDQDRIYDWIDQLGFATLVSINGTTPFATHLPLLLDRGNDRLYGHLARANPQWQHLDGQEVLATFLGPHHYISPAWYETGQAVPTWNYISIHVYGKVAIEKDGQRLSQLLRDTVRKYEGEDSPYRIDQVDARYLEGMAQSVVGFQIQMDRVEGKAKLSQNHPLERQERVAARLGQMGTDDAMAIAALMRTHIEQTKRGE